MIANVVRRISAAAAIGFSALPALADCPVYSSFESGTLDGWLSATTGGSGSTSVQMHNASMMAYVQQIGAISHSLSCDAAYVPGALVEFDMHAVANAGAFDERSESGVSISFLNAFNVSLGTGGLYNTTSAALLGPHDSAIDAVQHHYAATMSSFASLAGVAASAAVAKISLVFTAYAESGFNTSTSAVWFDNVSVPVPEPSTASLIFAGLAVTALVARRREHS